MICGIPVTTTDKSVGKDKIKLPFYKAKARVSNQLYDPPDVPPDTIDCDSLIHETFQLLLFQSRSHALQYNFSVVQFLFPRLLLLFPEPRNTVNVLNHRLCFLYRHTVRFLEILICEMIDGPWMAIWEIHKYRFENGKFDVFDVLLDAAPNKGHLELRMR